MSLFKKVWDTFDKSGEKIRSSFSSKGKKKNFVGVSDAKCKQSYYGQINKKICKNNCKHYNRQTKKCELGYKI